MELFERNQRVHNTALTQQQVTKEISVQEFRTKTLRIDF